MLISQVKEVLANLVSFRTVSSESNLDCIGFIERYFIQLGARCWVQYDDTFRKANLLESVGPAVPGGILLSGHTDVVPVEGQDWARDPWTAVDDRIYGRGTTDMKCYLAIMMVAATEASARNLKRPLHFSFSYDKEVGCEPPRLYRRPFG